jgi:hypothetical protein
MCLTVLFYLVPHPKLRHENAINVLEFMLDTSNAIVSYNETAFEVPRSMCYG